MAMDLLLFKYIISFHFYRQNFDWTMSNMMDVLLEGSPWLLDESVLPLFLVLRVLFWF
jgi:hypothetical protein